VADKLHQTVFISCPLYLGELSILRNEFRNEFGDSSPMLIGQEALLRENVRECMAWRRKDGCCAGWRRSGKTHISDAWSRPEPCMRALMKNAPMTHAVSGRTGHCG